jgi:hypothetical protein
LKVLDIISGGDIILSNNVCLTDYLFLEMKYSPVFTTVAINRETNLHGIRILGLFEILTHAIGIKFP